MLDRRRLQLAHIFQRAARAGVTACDLPDRFAERPKAEQERWIDAKLVEIHTGGDPRVRQMIARAKLTPKSDSIHQQTLARHARDALAACRSNHCGQWAKDARGRHGCLLRDGIENHLAGGGACLDSPQQFGPAHTPTIVPESLRKRVAVITFHFNPARYQRPAEVYRQWRPSMGELDVICIEMVLGNDEPEIPGSVVIRGDQRNVIWQKERLLNIGLEHLPSSVDYVAWVDHDILFDDPRWLSQSVDLIHKTGNAVQPWREMHYLDRLGSTIFSRPSASWTAKKGKYPGTGPGAAWVAKRKTLEEIGGIYDRNIIGGGDVIWFHALSGLRVDFLKRQSPASRRHQEDWIARVNGRVGYDCLDIGARHIWHGDKENRQYVTRDEILRRNDYDPEEDVDVGPNGLLRWTGNKPALEADVRMFFAARKEDG